MAPQATASGTLVYVADAETNSVFVYDFPSYKLVGMLKGFVGSYGLCSGKNGNVFVVNFGKQTGFGEVTEFAHGGTKPIATLSESDGNPDACAVNPVTGDLAVCNQNGPYIPGEGTQPGNVIIYKNAQGTPTEYKTTALHDAKYCGYDNKGNLFVSAYMATPSLEFAFFELPSGKSALTQITLDKPVGGPGGVQWDGKYIAVGDTQYKGTDESAIDRVSVSGTNGKIVQTWVPKGAYGLGQFVTEGTLFIGPNSNAAYVGVWKYDSAQYIVKAITGIDVPVAAALSTKG